MHRRRVSLLMMILGGTIIFALLISRQVDNIEDHKVDVIQRPTFPSFTAMDINGDEIASRDFLHKYTYVQIGSLNRESDRILFNKVATTYGRMLNILMIAESPIISNEWASLKRIKFIVKENGRLRMLFNAPEHGGCFLYDAQGKLVGSGNAQIGFEQGMKSLLDWHLKKLKFEDTLMIPAQGRYLSEYDWLEQFDELKLSHPHKYYLFGLFSSICDSCSSGLLINMLKEFAHRQVMD